MLRTYDYETKEEICEKLGIPPKNLNLIELRKCFKELKQHYQSPLGKHIEDFAIVFGKWAIGKHYRGTYYDKERDYRELAEIELSKRLSKGYTRGNFVDCMA